MDTRWATTQMDKLSCSELTGYYGKTKHISWHDRDFVKMFGLRSECDKQRHHRENLDTAAPSPN